MEQNPSLASIDDDSVLVGATPPVGRAKGGKARAAKLTQEERSAIAKNAAVSRWGTGAVVHEATHSGPLQLGESVIPCAVLPGEIRVLSERAVAKAFGAKRGGSHWLRLKDSKTAYRPVILSAVNLQAFISQELSDGLADRLLYIPKEGGASPGYGIRAELLPLICEVFINAAEAGKLKPSQIHLAVIAKILYRSLARTGIIALVDEATEYQKDRERRALQDFLSKLIGQELAKWERRFPQSFYRAIFRLKGWQYDRTSSRRPMEMARITADIIYARMGPGVLDQLRTLNPTDDHGGRRHKHHQWLTPGEGADALAKHIEKVTFLADSHLEGQYDQFYESLDRVAPNVQQPNLFFKNYDFESD